MRTFVAKGALALVGNRAHGRRGQIVVQLHDARHELEKCLALFPTEHSHDPILNAIDRFLAIVEKLRPLFGQKNQSLSPVLFA